MCLPEQGRFQEAKEQLGVVTKYWNLSTQKKLSSYVNISPANYEVTNEYCKTSRHTKINKIIVICKILDGLTQWPMNEYWNVSVQKIKSPIWKVHTKIPETRAEKEKEKKNKSIKCSTQMCSKHNQVLRLI